MVSIRAVGHTITIHQKGVTSMPSVPRIAILMAVYDPNLPWLREQLLSLNAQTYPNLVLYVRDDCSPTVPYSSICQAVSECVTAFPAVVNRNEHNLGSNLTFQRLVEEAEADRFAFCDQDDIWLPEKLAVMEQDMEEQGVLLVCSDVAVMDGEGKPAADHIRQVRPDCIMYSGTGHAPYLLFRNFVFGCASLVDAKTAKAAVPFCPYYYHDHYITLWCAEHGSIYAEPRSLIRYRIHGNNQTGVMHGVKDKESYCSVRLQIILDRLGWLDEHFACCPETKQAIQNGLCWATARKNYWLHGKDLKTMWHYRYLGSKITLFELFAARLPTPVLMYCIDLLRKGILR